MCDLFNDITTFAYGFRHVSGRLFMIICKKMTITNIYVQTYVQTCVQTYVQIYVHNMCCYTCITYGFIYIVLCAIYVSDMICK